MEPLRRLLNQLRTYWRELSRVRRIALVGAVIGVVLLIGAAVYFSPGLQYRTLFSDLAPEEAAAMRTRLTTANIPNRLEAGGTAITVPEDRLAEARVTLAAEGLPSRGGKGYELFDETSLTTTPFVQGVNYQRAIQAELARSIMAIDPVQSARVLIARSEPTPFVRDQKPPTASVVLKLKPGATLTRAQAASIVSLVARSVEGLKPENVTVVDSAGRMLSDPHAGEKEELPTPHLEYRRELENHLAAKAEEMLARHLGPGRAVIRVSADINFQKLKERKEVYSPEGRVAAAERLTTTKTTAPAARGVAGAVSNVARAGGVPPAPGGGAGGNSSEEVIQTDYLVSRTVQDTEDPMGAVTRLTIAAIADLSAPVEGGTAISLADAQEIIKQAVGFRTGRDEIKLTNAKLTLPTVPPETEDEVARLHRIQAYVSLARNISLALAVVLLLALVPLALLRRRRPAPPPPAPVPAPPAPEETRRARLEQLADMARDDPRRVAEVLGVMLGTAPR